MNNFFRVSHKSSKSKARLGEIKTDHGVIKTPAFISAATKGTIKSLPPQLIKEVGIQAGCVNTYHLVTHPGVEIIEKAGGIHKYSQLNMPLMSDSGGFQVFSLARASRDSVSQFFSHESLSPSGPLSKVQKIVSTSSPISSRKANIRREEEPFVIKISDDGVKFRSTYDGTLIEFTPEKSMEFQRQIGADINMAFDECTYYPATHDYAEKAMERTHRWLERCIKAKSKILNHKSQINPKYKIKNFKSLEFGVSNLFGACNLEFSAYLYGVIQGGTFEDLRKKSAEFVVSQDTPGVAIGGVSVGETKAEMREQVKWVSDYLPKDRPVHLLGVGQIDDIIDLVKYGVDTFDCVEPTRLARMGQIYKAQISIFSNATPQRGPWRLSQKQKSSLSEQIDITKSIYKNNLEKVDKDCNCYVCQNFTKSYLHHLFKQREILGYTLATYHNLWVMERLFEKIREIIADDLI
ncbi:MAG: tRNA guanosine(34) transglycosylase Tgt [Patescibacteria group bacterium]